MRVLKQNYCSVGTEYKFVFTKTTLCVPTYLSTLTYARNGGGFHFRLLNWTTVGCELRVGREGMRVCPLRWKNLYCTCVYMRSLCISMDVWSLTHAYWKLTVCTYSSRITIKKTYMFILERKYKHVRFLLNSFLKNKKLIHVVILLDYIFTKVEVL